MTDVLIHSPLARQDGQGNSVTAERLEGILTANKFRVIMETELYQGGDAQCLIALNARRSADTVASYKALHPDKPVIVILTGTDMNHPEMAEETSVTRLTMKAADALVCLHEAALKLLPDTFLDKCHVIYPSVMLPPGTRHQPNKNNKFNAIMAGNLRSEKNPKLAADTSNILPQSSGISITCYGKATGKIAEEIRRASSEITNFHWHEPISQAALFREMEHADVLLNTSTEEGGANAICEAICMELPVIASRIMGNIGMLGNDYQGYFASGDARALADILLRCTTDAAFYDTLKSQISRRTPLFSYAAESKAWVELVGEQLTH